MSLLAPLGAAGAIKRVGWGLVLLLLPLVLFGWGNVQHWRADTAQEQARVIRQWLASPSDALLQQLPWEARKQLARHVEPRQALQGQLEQLDADRRWTGMRKLMASLTCWLALAALLIALGAWLKLRFDAWRALRSSSYLYQGMTASWQSLGRCLSAYMLMLAASLCLALLYEASSAVSHAAQGGMSVLVVVLPLASVFIVCMRQVWRMRRHWPLMHSPSASFLARPLGKQAAPALWQWVEGLAKQLHAPAPDHIVVGLDQGFFVTSVPILLQPAGQALTGRTLYLPLPCLAALSQAEAAAIIGHELGHFRRRDTERGSETSARFSLMCAHYSAMLGDEHAPHWVVRPILWLAGQFLHRFQVAVHHWGRAQELLADRAGAEVAGPKLFVQALLRVIALGRVIDGLLVEQGGDGLLPALKLQLQRMPLQLGEEALEQAITHPFDTHPDIATRLQNLNVLLDPQLLQAALRVPSSADQQWFNALCSAPGRAADGNSTGSIARDFT
ncbi:M48 family metallopeptidase [Pseudomonas sp. AFG_SD02_1510_Pfu_092]|uniref:M48 family metallopeptidase n=1 Tax=Pseudomonas sp. AFG_SD02_1510_Pfu_092 TaxID=2259497 RepID=UPI001F4F0C72|nr:M48 family metallopeptidase [Pseudomonas sp. AFG_SD02_1510_Pfu_092]